MIRHAAIAAWKDPCANPTTRRVEFPLMKETKKAAQLDKADHVYKAGKCRKTDG